MANIDELQIKISASAKEADDAIKSLVSNLNNLNSVIEHLDTSKINAFSSAMSKIANIGTSTKTTSNALRGMSKQIQKSFGIKSQKGIRDVELALNDFYEATKRSSKDSSIPTQEMYVDAAKGLHKAITLNARYNKELEQNEQRVVDIYNAQKKAGTVYSLKSIKDAFPNDDDYKKYKEFLGSFVSTKNIAGEKGVQDIDSFFDKLYDKTNNPVFFGDQQNAIDYVAALKEVKRCLDLAKDSTVNYKQAVKDQIISEDNAKEGVVSVGEQLKMLVREQNELGTNQGLNGVVSALKAISSLNLPNMNNAAAAVKEIKTNVPTQTAKAVSDIGEAAAKVSQKAGEAQKALQEVAYSKKVILGSDANTGEPKITETGFTTKIPEMSAMDRIIKEINDNLSDFHTPDIDAFFQRGSAGAETLKNSVADINKELENLQQDTQSQDIGSGLSNSFQAATQSANKATSAIEQAINAAQKYHEVIQQMESGKIPFNENDFAAAVKGYSKAANYIKEYKAGLEGVGDKKVVSGDVVSNLIAFGDALKDVGSKLDAMGNKSIQLFKTLTTPLKWATNEYAEKFAHMRETIGEFRKNFQAHMAKMSQFWKRTMKTFTFMIVRKAITAIIEEVGKAVQSLAMYSNAMGTAFNTDISHMVADFQYLGRSIVSVFAPLLNYIVPIIDAIVDRIATLISYIGMLIAALGGSTSFTKAKKNVDNYAESLDQASKSAKNLTMGIDELNILSDSGGSGSSPASGWEDAWEDVDIPKWISEMADWFKDLWKRFTDPLKEAWRRAKQYVIDGFKTMIDSLQRLFGHVIDDFLTMWNQEKTIRMFEMMFRIVGDIFRVVRNIADQLDKAWQKGKVGLRIFENIRDICAIIVDHVRNVSYYMIGWAKELDFSPMLDGFEKLTRKMKGLADFIGGVFEDIMIEGVLKYIEFVIEDAIPHLEETLSSILDRFNFNALREKLKPLWSAIEEMLENIHTGVTNALGNLGKEIAEFTNSREFENFLQRIVDITKLITAERVEKVLTGLGKGILSVGKAVVKFVNSKPFMAFLEAIAKWIDNHSVDQIAGILEKIAIAIAGFKFGAFALEKLGGFFKVFAMFKSFTNLASIAKALTATGEGVGAVATGAGALSTAGAGLAVAVGAIANLVALFTEFKGASDLVKKLADNTDLLATDLFKVIAPLSILFSFGGLLPGIIAGIVGAFKGINDLKLDALTDTILTKGDTTVAMVKEWYSQATATISENAQRWKDIERNITQDKGDLEAYSQTLEGLEAAFSSAVQGTTGMADKLTAKYSDMTAAINNYVDQSTEALVEDLLNHREYYESRGQDVDKMIADLYKNAEEEKKVYNDTQEALQKAADAYSEAVNTYGENSTKAQDAYKTYQDALDKHMEAIKKYRTETEKIDTSYAVQQIEALGKSLDLSQYSNMEEAATDIRGAIQDIHAAYESGLSDINTTVKGKMEFLQDQLKEGRITEEEYKLRVDDITRQWTEDTNTLVDATKQSLDFFDEQLAGKLEEVRANAEQQWESANPIAQFFMGDKNAYVTSQMQNYVDEFFGETGLMGSLNSAFESLPGGVEPTATQSMTDIVESAGKQLNTWDKVINANSLSDAIKIVTDSASTTITEWTDNLKTEVPQKAKAFIDDFPTSFNEAWTNVTDWFTGKKEEIGQNVENMLSDAPEKVGYALGFVLAKLEQFRIDTMLWAAQNIPQIVADIAEKFANLKDKFWEKLDEALKKLYEWKAQFNVFITTEIPIIIADFMREFSTIPEKMLSLGEDIVNGLIEGIKSKWDSSIEDVKNFCKGFVQGMRDGFRSHSPSEETKEVGEDVLAGLLLPFTVDKVSQLNGFVQAFIDVFRIQLSPDKFTAIGSTVIQGILQPISSSSGQFVAATDLIFASVTQAVQTNIEVLGTTVMTLMQTFMETYILPFFTLESWQVIFDTLLNETFIPLFEQFRVWFAEEAMTPWWEEDLLSWFADDKWNEEIFTPLQENIQSNWDLFSSWWDASMSDWWDNHVLPWFEKAKWEEQFNHILEVTKKVFDLVKEAIKTRIDEAKEAVLSACDEMKTAISAFMTAIDGMLSKLSDFNGFSGDVTFSFGGKQFASGGFPAYGSLFIAGEPGAGTEWVGNVGGRTGVVSNNEITGIADAVYATGSAETELLGQLLGIGRAMLDKEPIVINDKDIARMANRGQEQLGMSIIS